MGLRQVKAEYETAGVRHIWLIDPRLETLSVYAEGDLRLVKTLTTGDGIELTHEDAFARYQP